MKTMLIMLGYAAAAVAQTGTLTCNDGNNRGNHSEVHRCEVREQTVPFAGRLSVDAGQNGGVSVKGWDNGNVLVRARVEAWGPDEGTANSNFSQVSLNLSAGQVTASGPSHGKHEGWAVSYEIFLPRQADLNLKATNGGLSITEVRGNIRFETMNGGVHLKGVAGDVDGKTTNGGVHIELAGSRWDGAKLEVRTVNGGINLSMPQNYSAHFETATENGHVNIGVPMTVHGEIGKRIVTDLGSGGPTIHVETTNGGVNLRQM